MITVTTLGGFTNTEKKLKNIDFSRIPNIMQKYGAAGVEQLRLATPLDTGATSDAWDYEVVKTARGYDLRFTNSEGDGVTVVILLQYGHATRAGAWVQGVDFINPALRPIFASLTNEIWKEVERR
jgi:hypothetical protein